MARKNMRVKCPFCGWHSTMSKAKRTLACNKCRKAIDLDAEYIVDKYY